MSKIVWLSDTDFKSSGYFNITMPLCSELVSLGHEVKVVGFGYKGEEHYFPFSIIPANNLSDSLAVLQNLSILWKPDIAIVALDIWMHDNIMRSMQNRPFDYVGIMPVESDPLCLSWAMVMMQMQKSLVISEFGTQEAKKAGVTNVTHLPVGIDTNLWRVPTEDERKSLRTSFGLEESAFVVLTVADNQERKNLAASMQMFADFVYDHPHVSDTLIQELNLTPKVDAKYILITREFSMLGWKLRELAQEFGINNQMMLFERGVGFKELWSLYAIADVFLLTSKSEGLGMPILESMAVKLPTIATNCTGMAELLADNRGLLVDYDYVHRDPFGNGRRYWADITHGTSLLKGIRDKSLLPDVDAARKYVEGRTWKNAANVLESVLKEIEDGKEKQKTE